jgi:peptidoglycan/xylan/chitin deacetylase (PgdA/CDA1 family)
MIDWNHDDEDDGKRFAALLGKLHEKCDFVNFETAVRMVVNHENVNRPTIAFSFDDGWRDCYTQIAPQLERFGVNAMFFVNPNFADAADNNDKDYIDNFTVNTTKSPGKHPMTWEQMKDLQKRGFLIGAHTMDHYCINDDNSEVLEHQIGECKKVIEDRLGLSCDYFAFPYGRLEHANSASIEIACKHYKYVFSQSDYKNYFSFGGKVINRRHFEPFWPVNHVKYFISCKKRY